MVEVVFRKKLHRNYISGLQNGRTHRTKRGKKRFPRFALLSKVAFKFVVVKCSTLKKIQTLELKSGCLFQKLTYFLKIESWQNFVNMENADFFFFPIVLDRFRVFIWCKICHAPINAFFIVLPVLQRIVVLYHQKEVGFRVQFLHRFTPLDKCLVQLSFFLSWLLMLCRSLHFTAAGVSVRIRALLACCKG